MPEPEGKTPLRPLEPLLRRRESRPLRHEGGAEGDVGADCGVGGGQDAEAESAVSRGRVFDGDVATRLQPHPGSGPANPQCVCDRIGEQYHPPQQGWPDGL